MSSLPALYKLKGRCLAVSSHCPLNRKGFFSEISSYSTGCVSNLQNLFPSSLFCFSGRGDLYYAVMLGPYLLKPVALRGQLLCSFGIQLCPNSHPQRRPRYVDPRVLPGNAFSKSLVMRYSIHLFLKFCIFRKKSIQTIVFRFAR